MKFSHRVLLGVATVVAFATALTAGGMASAGTVVATAPHAAATAPQAAAIAGTPVAHNISGKLLAQIAGTTKDGRTVSGTFIPLHFSNLNGKLYVRGLINGVVHNANGTTSTFALLRTMLVKTINGVPALATTAKALAAPAVAAACDILRLVLGPLHLDLLGLVVDLNRVVLNIVAQSGAGNLLGNLLCAVTGLLDGGLNGLLGRIGALLNQILGVLRLGG